METDRTVDGPHPGPLPTNLRLVPGEGASRREMFRACLRFAGLAGLAALCGLLCGRVRVSGAECGRPGACRGCAAFDRCALPQNEPSRE